MLMTIIARFATNKAFDLAQVSFWTSEAAGINAAYRLACKHILKRMQASTTANVYDAAVIESLDIPPELSSRLIEDQRQMALIFVEMLTDPATRADNRKALDAAIMKYFKSLFDGKAEADDTERTTSQPAPAN